MAAFQTSNAVVIYTLRFFFSDSWNQDSQYLTGSCHGFQKPIRLKATMQLKVTITYQERNYTLCCNTTAEAIMYRFYPTGTYRTAHISSLTSGPALRMWTLCSIPGIMPTWSPCLVWCSAIVVLKSLIYFRKRAPAFHFAVGLTHKQPVLPFWLYCIC